MKYYTMSSPMAVWRCSGVVEMYCRCSECSGVVEFLQMWSFLKVRSHLELNLHCYALLSMKWDHLDSCSYLYHTFLPKGNDIVNHSYWIATPRRSTGLRRKNMWRDRAKCGFWSDFWRNQSENKTNAFSGISPHNFDSKKKLFQK